MPNPPNLQTVFETMHIKCFSLKVSRLIPEVLSHVSKKLTIPFIWDKQSKLHIFITQKELSATLDLTRNLTLFQTNCPLLANLKMLFCSKLVIFKVTVTLRSIL